MSSEKIINAIGLLDDELIEDAERKPSKKSYVIYIKYSAVAASLLLLVLAAFFLRNSFKEPESKFEKSLLAEVDETEKPTDDQPDMTDAPVLPTEDIQTKRPVSEEMIADKEDELFHVEVAYGAVITPEPVVTEAPVISYPSENTNETEEVKPSEDVGSMEDEKESDETGDEIVSTEIPVITEKPEEEDTWTETFVATNVEASFGFGKSDAKYLVEKLYYSELGVNILGNVDSDWWYGVKIGEYVYTQAEVAVSDNYIESYIGEGILKGVHRINYITEETKAYIYKIAGVSENAAIAVQIDEQEGYYLFVNPDFKTETFSKFVEAYNLRNFSELNAVAIYNQWGNTISEEIDSNVLWDILTAEGGYAVDYKSLYFDCTIAAGIKMDVSMYGCEDVPITLFDEGYVVVYLGEVNGAYYVGADKIALIKGRINNSK